MTQSHLLPLEACTNVDSVGGKAASLARLIACGFRVPPGLCITIEAYRTCLQANGFFPLVRWRDVLQASAEDRRRLLADCETAVQHIDCSDLIAHVREALSRLGQPANTLWAIRSSATREDASHASFAGLYRTHLGIMSRGLESAIKDVWASVWHEQVVRYYLRSGPIETPPAMAVVIQPMLDAQVAGIAYSIHPLTGRADQVVVNAVPGLGASLVRGAVTPDQYVLRLTPGEKSFTVAEHLLATKRTRLRLGQEGVREEDISPHSTKCSSLTDVQLNEVTRITKQVEQMLATPVDIEWVIDGGGLWLLQARPVTGLPRSARLTNDDCEWSRANFKETMPELPSPLGLSFLERFMEAYIIAPYRRLGCTVPEGVTSVRTLHGRPYINMTLFHTFISQLRGDPSFVTEQMGGEPLIKVPEVRPVGWFSFCRAGIVMMGEMRRAVKNGPNWFAEMKAMAMEFRNDRLQRFAIEDVAQQLEKLERWLDDHELTFAIAGGVSQCLQALGAVLPRWAGSDWRALLNAALQGQGSVISAQQIVRLAELVQIAKEDPSVTRMFADAGWNFRDFRPALKHTEFLRVFERFLEDYGHRGVGESDIMSPRFGDQPEILLSVLRTQIRAASGPTSATMLARQASTREQALVEIRQRCGWRLHRWVYFDWWCRRLCRFFALREANRHHLMYYSMAVRNLLRRLGELLVMRNLVRSWDDIFFLLPGERADISAGRQYDWQSLVRRRRKEREHHATVHVPDTIRDWGDLSPGQAAQRDDLPDGTLRGIPISAGSVVGPVRHVLTIADWSKVTSGDIIVAHVIEPGMAPLFGIAAGLVVEMGGTLSHGAIIAREYGLPTVANVSNVTTRFRDGQRVAVDATEGIVRLIE